MCNVLGRFKKKNRQQANKPQFEYILLIKVVWIFQRKYDLLLVKVHCFACRC